MATLPVGAGLGSSAALSVATAAALVQVHAALTSGGSGEGVLDGAAAPVTIGEFGAGVPPAPAIRSVINDWAFSAETLFHGTPSGLDNTVSTCVRLCRLLLAPVGRAPRCCRAARGCAHE